VQVNLSNISVSPGEFVLYISQSRWMSFLNCFMSWKWCCSVLNHVSVKTLTNLWWWVHILLLFIGLYFQPCVPNGSVCFHSLITIYVPSKIAFAFNDSLYIRCQA